MNYKVLRIMIPGILALVLLQCRPQEKTEISFEELQSLVSENMQFAQQKISYFLENLDFNTYPGSIDDAGELQTLQPSSWEAGYLAGILWHLYDYTEQEKWRVFAQQWTAGLELQQFNKKSHDLLFMLYSSFGNGYRITGDSLYKDVLLLGAKLMAERYDPGIRCIKSWDPFYESLTVQFPVIIDALLSNEMFFYVSEITGDTTYSRMAYQHALRTKQDFFRDNHSTYYLLDYDTITHKVIKKGTWMGESDESTWARGHARAIYGAVITFRETGDSSFLDLARNAADFYMEHPRLPDDLVPYWDFDDPDIPNAPRDASAACIAASGILELYQHLPENERGPYFEFAVRTLQSLASDQYRNRPDENLGFILKHSTGSRSWNINIDQPKISADYYFIESLIKLQRIIE
ncbi:MAG: glucuronyl hydrolase [Bacteroidota bacterium]